MAKKKYKIQTWKLAVEGEFAFEKTAIRILADKYMSRSKCDPPGEHPLELMANSGKISVKNPRSKQIEKIAKSVGLYVYEEVYGHKQWVLKYHLHIHPFKKNHWWEAMEGSDFDFEECKFKYEIVVPEKEKV